MELIDKVPDMIAWLQSTLVPWLDEHLGVTTTFDVNSLKNVLTSNLAQTGNIATIAWKTLFSSSKTLAVWFANLLIIPVVIFYLLRDWDKVTKGLHNLLPRRSEQAIIQLFTECDGVLGAFLRGQLLVMLALGFLYSLGLTIIGLKMGLLIGLLAGILCIVPYLGFIVGIGAALIAAIFQFGDILHCIYVVIVFIVAQSIEASILTPVLVGDRIGLHPVAVIFAILIGGHLFGFFGILLALPVAAVIMVFVRHLRQRYMNSQLYKA
jgi:predicted PurR-regulated permease PerM